MKIRYILALCLAVAAINSHAHDQIVHEAITANATASAFSDSSACKDFVNIISPDLQLVIATNSMVAGSFNEDFADHMGDVGGNRSFNHFYDPLDTSDGKGLSEVPPDNCLSVQIRCFNSLANGKAFCSESSKD